MSDMNDQMQEYQDWLRFAQANYDSAKYLYDSPLHPKPLEIICYHCQQAAEKAVKALIVYFGSRGGMPKVHDISFLIFLISVFRGDGVFRTVRINRDRAVLCRHKDIGADLLVFLQRLLMRMAVVVVDAA